MNDELITVGRLGKTRGVHGELYIIPLTDFPERFLDLKEIYVGFRGKWDKMVIVSSRLVGGRPVIGFEGYASPEASARLTNRDLALPRDQLMELPEDSYYMFDLIGCLVYDETSGEHVGELVDIETYPANDVYVIRMLDRTVRYCPAIKDAVKSVDVEQKKIVVAASSLFQQE